MDNYNLFKGLVTHVLDPSTFWMRIGTVCDMHMFLEYQQRLDAFYNTDLSKYMCSLDQMHPGYLIVVAQAAKDDGYHWERAQITRVDSDNKTADVFFVDLGYTFIVEVDSCRAITPELFHFLPLQASRVSLGGVKPLSSSWTSRATNLLQKQTDGQEVLTLLMHYDEASMCYSVVIYIRQSDGTWRSLIHEMQDKELAVSTGDVIQEVFTDDVVEQCLQRMEERNKQHREAETNGVEESERTLVEKEDEEEEEVQEQWADEFVAGGSDDFLANLMKASQAGTDDDDGQDEVPSPSPPPPPPSDKERVVTGYDLNMLMQTRSISLSQMQLEKVMEAQEVTKTNIERDMQRMDSVCSQHEEQDWDAVQDTDYHGDIVSQIYQGVLERQYSSDDGTNILWDGSKLHELALPPKQTEAATTTSSSNANKKEDIGRRYYHHKEEREDYGYGTDSPHHDTGGGLTEMDSYRLEKQIKEILLNPERMESDVVCASIYGVVEPDVDAPVDHLCVVICAILEHIMQDTSQDSEIAFAILETYSDAYEFGTAIVQVINDLKDRFVKKHQSQRLANRHRDFAHVLALVCKQAEDWEGTCKVVQDLAVALTERWVIFNKKRHLSGDDLVQCELVFLESAQAFLMECYDLVSTKYPSNLTEIMKDVRCKLLQDKTVRSVRTLLLDMLLTINSCGGQLGKQLVSQYSVGTQTDHAEDADKKDDCVPHVGSGGDCVPSFKHTATSLPIEPITGLEHVSPSKLKRLPPRFLKKYLPEQALTEPQGPPAVSHEASDNTEANQCDYNGVSMNLHSNTADHHLSVSKAFSGLSMTDQLAYGQVNAERMDAYVGDYHEEEELYTPWQTGNVNQTSFMENISPTQLLGKGKMPPLPTIVSEKNSPSPKHVLGEKSPSPKPVLGEKSPSPKPVLGKKSLSPRPVFGKKSPSPLTAVECESPSPETVSKTMSPPPRSVMEIISSSLESFRAAVGTNKRDSGEDKVQTLEENFDHGPGGFSSSMPSGDDWKGEQQDEEEMEEEGKESSEQIVKIRIERDTTIRYTPQQLRDLNPFAGQPKLPLWDLWEPKEVLEKMIALKNPGKSSLEDDQDWRVRPGASVEDKKQVGSSVDPSPASAKWKGSHNSSNLHMESGQVYLNVGSGLQGIASDLFKSAEMDESEKKESEEGENWGGGEVWHDTSGDVGEVGEFLKPKKQNELKGKKGKKKRGREILLDQFLQEQAALKQLSEEVETEGVVNGSNDNDDPFSPESLKMYEELEQQGVGIDHGLEAIDSLSIKFGSHASSSSKRPAMFSSIRSELPSVQKNSKPWTPSSRRFCTRCGSKDHTVYECNESRLL